MGRIKHSVIGALMLSAVFALSGCFGPPAPAPPQHFRRPGHCPDANRQLRCPHIHGESRAAGHPGCDHGAHNVRAAVVNARQSNDNGGTGVSGASGAGRPADHLLHRH
nr:hypothetical protein GCM10017547_04100 [Pseudarthrobacter oxydans]